MHSTLALSASDQSLNDEHVLTLRYPIPQPFRQFLQVICVLTAPVALVKTGISLVHLYAAAENIVAIDVEERRLAAEQKKD